MKRPDEVKRSREDGAALRQRLDRTALTADDRRVLGHLLEWYFGLVFTIQETTLSLKRLRTLLFGEPMKKRKGAPPEPSSGARQRDEAAPGAAGSAAETQAQQAQEPRRPGHGRQSAQAYGGAERVVCQPATLQIGPRCPVCGRGRL
jgi:hypothetical protein